MRLMVVTNNTDWATQLRKYFESVWKVTDTVFIDHKEALAKFLELAPTHVLVGEYEHEDLRDRSWPGFRTWTDLKNAASPGQVILRTGFMQNPGSDFIRLPFEVDDLKAKLGI